MRTASYNACFVCGADLTDVAATRLTPVRVAREANVWRAPDSDGAYYTLVGFACPGDWARRAVEEMRAWITQVAGSAR